MNPARVVAPSPHLPLRLWPGVMIVAVQWLAWWVVPIIVSDSTAGLVSALGGILGGAAVCMWWVFFSRASRVERWGGLGLVVVAMAMTLRILHPSIAQGNMGFQFFLYAIPSLSLALVLWAVASRHLPQRERQVTMVATILLASGSWALARSDGITGDGAAQLAWRWTPTAEARLLAGTTDVAARHRTLPGDTKKQRSFHWTGLRGPRRDGVIHDVRLETDWSQSPPIELWRRPVGPAVSSFAVSDTLLYTHEQRGDHEVVASYAVETGEPVWQHRDDARFWDSHVGAGPRATPTIASGRLFTFGATGILNALAPSDGTLHWSRDAAADTQSPLPLWGFVSSPLVVDDLVIIHTDALIAYDIEDGELRWIGPGSGGSYSSPQLVAIQGVPQIVMVGHGGVVSVAPTDGTLLWTHPWPGIGIVQPAVTPQGDILVSMVSEAAAPIGTRRVEVTRELAEWTTTERWTSTRLKPSFSDFVVHDDHVFGFDGRILTSISVEDGIRAWKGGRYGHGQLVLLADQDLLLVLSEEGDLALVEAAPDAYTEVARFAAIDGKTWSHPTLIGNILLVRNGQEMAAFELPLAERTAPPRPPATP